MVGDPYRGRARWFSQTAIGAALYESRVTHPEWCNENVVLENFAVDDHVMLLAVATCASTARWSFRRALTCWRERRNFTRKCPGGEL